MVIQLLRKFIIPYLYLFFANKGEVKAIIIAQIYYFLFVSRALHFANKK